MGNGALKVAREENALDLLLGFDLPCWLNKPDQKILSQDGFYLVELHLFRADN